MIGALTKKTVAAAGTPEALIANRLVVQRVRLQAEHDNTGRIYVGLANMNVATGEQVLGVIGIPPATGDVPVFDLGVSGVPGGVNLADLYIDASVNGDGVWIAYA